MIKKLPDINKLKDKTVASVVDGYDAFFLVELLKSTKSDILYIMSDGVSMAQTADILGFISPNTKVLTLPAWDTVPYDRVSPNSAIVAQRVETLSELSLEPHAKQPRIILATVSSVLQKLPPAKTFLNSIREVSVGKELNFNAFLHYATINGYRRVEQVMEPGEYATRGDIIDIFPVGSEDPLRIDLFGDEVEKIRTFDAISQRTSGELKSYQFKVMGEMILDENSIKTFRANYREAFGAVSNKDEIYEAVSSGQQYMGMESFLPLFYDEPLPNIFNYLPMAEIVVGRNVFEAIKGKIESIFDYYVARQDALKNKNNLQEVDAFRPVKPDTMYLSDKEFSVIIEQKQAIRLTSLSLPDDDSTINLEVIPARDFSHNKNQLQLYKELDEYLKTGEPTERGSLGRIITCYSEGSRERLFSLMSEHGIKDLTFADTWKETLAKSKTKTVLTILNLNHGFKSKDLCFISEQDILGEKRNRKKPKKASSKDFIADVSSLAVGELVVHIEHGIGKFLGLENITAGGAPHDCLKILYANAAKLFVPVENIDVLSRYGLEDENVQLDTLG
ncbi:MAG: hypothetical protein LBL47_03120, partial [Lactobacillus sp.]|nr:hypothetical protein [Lactobacillus sp.]